MLIICSERCIVTAGDAFCKYGQQSRQLSELKAGHRLMGYLQSNNNGVICLEHLNRHQSTPGRQKIYIVIISSRTN